MKTNAVAFLLLWPGILSAQAQTTSPLTLQRTIALPEGTGKFDHFAYSPAGNRLFVAATGNHSIEVIDLSSDKVAQTLPGLGKPHGLAWIGETGRLFASDGLQADLKI
jgi:YVTN family beta-propeller protein